MFLRVQVKHSTLDAWIGSEYVCVQIASSNVLCHHNKLLMGYFQLLYSLGIISLPFNIPELHWQHLFEKSEEVETRCFYLSYTIDIHAPWKQHLLLKQTGTTTILSFGYKSVWPSSHPCLWQNPCSGCNSEIILL